MPLVHRLLITLRTLLEDEPETPKSRRRRPNTGNRNNRNRQTSALILTFRDLFRSGGLNILLDEMEVNRRQSRKNSFNFSCGMSNAACKTTIPKTSLSLENQPNRITESRVCLSNQNDAIIPANNSVWQEETFPLLQEESASLVHCTDLVPSPLPSLRAGLFSSFVVSRKKDPGELTVPLNPDDENKTVETLKKVLKWSPRKQNSATFAVSLPVEEKHTAIAIVENAVNRVKEEQLRKKKRKFMWLKIC